jgi:hypothetical protein
MKVFENMIPSRIFETSKKVGRKMTVHGSGGYLLVSHRGGRDSRLGQSMWDLWWIVWQWNWFLSEFFGFLLVSIIPRDSPYSYITWWPQF